MSDRTIKSDPLSNKELSSLLVHGGTTRTSFDETCEAIFMTSGYVYKSAEEAEQAFLQDGKRYVYSRFSNPTVAMFEERLRLLEGAEACLATASGMAAVTAAILCQVQTGDRVVASRALFVSCDYILTIVLPRLGVTVELVDGRNLYEWQRALSKPTRLVFCETPSNPCLEIIDLPAVAELAHKAGAQFIVDNVFASPLLQRPLEMGADVVVYSATKHIDGQGRCLGGAVLGRKSFISEVLHPYLRNTGPSLSPFNAWLLLKGMETLDLRVERQCRTAEEIAQALTKNPAIKNVLYPFAEDHPQQELARRQMKQGGSLISFDMNGGKDAAFRFLNALRFIRLSNNLGDSKTLATHPATTTHSRLTPEARAIVGISDGLVRLSIGLESTVDILEDLTQALKKS